MSSRGGDRSFCRSYAPALAVAVAAATLAGCAKPSVVSSKPEWGATRQASAHHNPQTLRAANQVPPATNKPAAKPSSYGVASYYSDDTETASGEKFDPSLMTAAHRTLPFGTRVRVTNVQTGQSVTVRINDRGPFIPGREVDLSYSAAETIGMVERGITKVKLEVVR